MKAGTAMLLLVGVIPLLYGFLLEVVVLMPVRVPLNQSPVYFIWQVSIDRLSFIAALNGYENGMMKTMK